MIPEINIVSETPEAKRIISKDVTPERLESLREGVIHFCRKSKSICDPMNMWSYISRILRGQSDAEIWWSYDGGCVKGFLVSTVKQDFDGKWTAYIQFGWSSTSDGKYYLETIINDYLNKGVSRIQFMTKRNPCVFQRWLGEAWKSGGSIFELKGDL